LLVIINLSIFWFTLLRRQRGGLECLSGRVERGWSTRSGSLCSRGDRLGVGIGFLDIVRFVVRWWCCSTHSCKVLLGNPRRLSLADVTQCTCSSKLEIGSAIRLAESSDRIEDHLTHRLCNRELLSNSLEDDDGVTDMHVLSRVETHLESSIQVGVPLVQQYTVLFIVEEGLRGVIWIEFSCKSSKLSLCSERVLLIRSFVGVPWWKLLQNLVQEATKVLRFSGCTLEHERWQLILAQETVQQMHSTESRSAVVVEELQHHVGVVSVQRRIHHSREEAVLKKAGV
jgi:hypothetical protein